MLIALESAAFRIIRAVFLWIKKGCPVGPKMAYGEKTKSEIEKKENTVNINVLICLLLSRIGLEVPFGVKATH
jgi:hypothetical protein